MSDVTLDSPPPMRRRSLPPPTDPMAPATAGMLHAHAEEDAEDSDAILAGVQRIAKGQRQIEKHLEAGATAYLTKGAFQDSTFADTVRDLVGDASGGAA